LESIDTSRAQPAPTAGRVSEAWNDAHRVTRVSLTACCVTTAALGCLLPGPLVIRLAVIATGVSLALAALVDVHERKLPNRLLAASIATTLAGAAATLDAAVVARCVAGSLVGGGLLLVVRLVRGVGMGDVKMAGAVGASAGSFHVLAAPAAIAVAAFAASAYAVAASRQRLALGPWLWFGWAVSLLAIAVRWQA
jgi:leader peptidase (prepilin peptidase) / N-methyltransferase